MEKFQNKYRIPTARATWHDYNGGEYFITICTAHMKHYFGEIYNGEMIYTTMGHYAVENLEQIKTHYPYCEIPTFVVMPNHIHAIVVIDDSAKTGGTGDAGRLKNDVPDEKMQSISHQRGRLSTSMGGFKRAITCFANSNKIDFGWQARFHDHIIRNQEEMNAYATYIENNPLKWKDDKFYT